MTRCLKVLQLFATLMDCSFIDNSADRMVRQEMFEAKRITIFQESSKVGLLCPGCEIAVIFICRTVRF